MDLRLVLSISYEILEKNSEYRDSLLCILYITSIN